MTLTITAMIITKWYYVKNHLYGLSTLVRIATDVACYWSLVGHTSELWPIGWMYLFIYLFIHNEYRTRVHKNM